MKSSITMSLNKRIGLILWITSCIIGSVVYGLIFTYWFNSLKGFDEMNTLEVFFIIFVLFTLSFAFSTPYIVYLLIRIRQLPSKKMKCKEFNLVFNIYSILIYLFLSVKLVSWIEGLQLMTTYYLLGLVSLNLYLNSKKKLYNIT